MILWYSFVEILKTDEDEMAARATTDSGSPWYSGHFPDDPILPGIAQLKMVADLITLSRGNGMRMRGVSRVKFRKIVRPGELLDIQATPGNIANHYSFRISSDNEDICSGMMFFAITVEK